MVFSSLANRSSNDVKMLTIPLVSCELLEAASCRKPNPDSTYNNISQYIFEYIVVQQLKLTQVRTVTMSRYYES